MVMIEKVADERLEMDGQPEKENKYRLEIYTLGHFHVRRGEQLFTEDAGRSYQLWKLFKYLLTYCDRPNHPELLMEDLYPEEELKDPDRTLRNLIYRLRRLLANDMPKGLEQEYIILTQGRYCFNLSSNYWLDVKEFRDLSCKAVKMAAMDPGKAIVLYQKALSLYKGDYLPDNIYDDWVVIRRDYYHRSYLENVFGVLMLLKNAGRYPELKDVCEKAFLIEPFQEELHIFFMEALLEEGKTGLAKIHYNHASSLLYREAGLKPSGEMRELYKKITSEKLPLEKTRQSSCKGLGPGWETRGAFSCDPETFLGLCRQEEIQAVMKEEVEENEQTVFWGCLTLVQTGDNVQTDEAMVLLDDVLRRNLRRGDTICRWSDNQYYLILPCPEHEYALKTLERIKNCFLGCRAFDAILLDYTSGPLRIRRKEPRRLRSFA